MASSSASASAGSFAGASGGSFAGSGYGNPPVSDRGSFVDSATNAVNTPTADYMPNAFSWGYNNNGGGNGQCLDEPIASSLELSRIPGWRLSRGCMQYFKI